MNSDATKPSESFDASEVVELLRYIEERLAAAWVEGDHSFIEQILADDWSVTDLTGRVLKKAEVMEEAFGSKDQQIVSMRIDKISVRPFGLGNCDGKNSRGWGVSGRGGGSYASFHRCVCEPKRKLASRRFASYLNQPMKPVTTQRAAESVAADGAIACFLSNFFPSA